MKRSAVWLQKWIALGLGFPKSSIYCWQGCCLCLSLAKDIWSFPLYSRHTHASSPKAWMQPRTQEATQHLGCYGYRGKPLTSVRLTRKLDQGPTSCALAWQVNGALPICRDTSDFQDCALLYPGHLLFRPDRGRRSFSSARKHWLCLQPSLRSKAKSFKSSFCFQGQGGEKKFWKVPRN